MRHTLAQRIAIGAVVLLPPLGAAAQSPPPPLMQVGIGPTGTMYNGNNLQRSPVGRAPAPQQGGGGVTGTSTGGASGDSTGGGAGGGEH